MKTFQELKKNIKNIKEGLPSFKVAMLGDVATQFLSTAIRGVAIERGYNVELYEAPFNEVEQQILDPNSELYRFAPKYVIILQSTHKFNERYSLTESDKQKDISDDRLHFIEQACQLMQWRIIYYNYPEIEDTVFGSYANKVESSFTYQIRKLNYELMNLSQRLSNLFICDIAGLQNKLGRDFMFDASVYASTEMIFSLAAIPYVASRTVDIMMALEGKEKKCIILDLDNTLWGGVIGDDGVEGIEIGHGIGIGKVFSEFQEWVKKLYSRGIIICICSKNDEAKAKEPFEKHPDMILRLKDISVFIANWENKVENIISIQKILNIGFDSMVFIDDNPFERNIVRENIAGIMVPELPEDPADYLEYIYSLNIFEASSFNKEDSDRTRQYQEQAKRTEFASNFDSEADFLQSLNMISKVEGFTKFNIPRVAQLSQRSNQFNLRTVRYTESDVEAMSKDNKVVDLAFSLKDKFGDNGLISVIVMREIDNESLFIDTWLMSCRVLNRGMENFVLNKIVSEAKKNKYKKIIGEYIETKKNALVKDHYEKMGFEKENINSNRYLLNVDTYMELQSFIKEA